MPTSGSVVVGVDFSACSASALAQGVRIAAWTRQPVHALHVIDTLALVELEAAFAPSGLDLLPHLREEARASWDRLSRDVAGAAGASFEVVVGNPLSALVEGVHRHRAGLLVLGVHGERAHRGAGMLAGAATRAAPANVLLVQEGRAAAFRTVVVGIDYSETSRLALEAAMRLAAQDGSQVHVVHVYRAPWAGLHLRPPAIRDDPTAQARYRDILRQRLEAFCEPGSPQTLWTRPRFEVIEHRSHGVGLAEYVRTSGADLVVLGTRGRTNLRDVVLGSTAERVVREAPCSVLAVRPAGGASQQSPASP
jgi:universal stress protein E